MRANPLPGCLAFWFQIDRNIASGRRTVATSRTARPSRTARRAAMRSGGAEKNSSEETRTFGRSVASSSAVRAPASAARSGRSPRTGSAMPFSAKASRCCAWWKRHTSG